MLSRRHNDLANLDRIIKIADNTSIQAKAAVGSLSQNGDFSGVGEAFGQVEGFDLTDLRPLPQPILGDYLSHFGVALSALTLALLSLAPGWRISLVALPAMMIGVFGFPSGIFDLQLHGIGAGMASLGIDLAGAYWMPDRDRHNVDCSAQKRATSSAGTGKNDPHPRRIDDLVTSLARYPRRSNRRGGDSL